MLKYSYPTREVYKISKWLMVLKQYLNKKVNHRKTAALENLAIEMKKNRLF